MYSKLIEANVGKKVTVEGTGRDYTIAGFADKIGTMKSGEKAPYMLLLFGDLDNGHFHPIHPETAKGLCKKGVVPGMRILNDIAAETSVVEAAGTSVEPVVVDSKPEAAVTVKAESKKVGAIRIFNEEKAKLNDDTLRARVVARFKSELEMSAPGSATYYQSCKSGAYK